MIALNQNSEVYLAVESVDFRKGINGLCGVCRQQFKKDPSSGAYFVFRNKRRKALKIIYYDGTGYWLFTKRLSSGKIPWWPKKADKISREDSRIVRTMLLGGNPDSAEFTDDWKRLI